MQNGNFWGNARDIGIIIIAGLTFVGAVEYFYYLSGMGILVEQITVSPMTLLVISIGVLLDVVIHDWSLILAALLLLAYAWNYNSSFRSAALSRPLQAAFVAVAFAVLFFIARDAAKQNVRNVREGKVTTLSYVTFEPQKGGGIPNYMSNPDGNHRTFLALETASSVFVFSQNQSAYDAHGYRVYPAGQVFEINRKDLASVTTFVPNLQVKK